MRTASAVRRRLTLAGGTSILLLASVLVASPAPAVTACVTPPPTMPTAQLVPGMTGVGQTVIKGDAIEPFDVEVLGVLPDAIFLGIDVIVMEMTGPADFVATTGGAVAGMSGSPVYVNGKLAGALAWAIAEDRHIFGATAAEDMMSLFTIAGGSTKPMPTEIALTRDVRRAIASATGASLAETATSMQALPVPLGVSSTGGRSLADIEATFADHGIAVSPYRAASASAPTLSALDPAPMVPGGGFGMALSYGDVSWYGFGTTTAVCGDYVLGWGHPFWASGEVSMGMSDVDVLAIDNGNFWGTKIGVLTDPEGVMAQDRYAGVVGIEGLMPTVIPIDSTFSSPDSGLSRVGHTDVSWDEGWFVAEAAWSHAYANVGYVLQADAPGTARLSWTIEGTREDGSPFSVSNHSMQHSDWYAGSNVWRLADALYTLVYNGFEEIAFTGVDMTGMATEDNLTARIVKVRTASSLQPTLKARHVLKAAPGDTITIEATLDPVDGDPVIAVLALKLPKGARGEREIELRGGKERYYNYRGIESLDDLLAMLSGGEHGNDLIAKGFNRSSTQEQDVIVKGKDRFLVRIIR